MKRSFQWWWVAILVLPIGFGLLRLRMDVEVLNLLPADVPAVHGLKLQQRYFANMRELVITVSGDQAEATEATAQSLAVSLRRETNLISYVVWQPPWLEHPEQTAELIAYLWMNQPPEELKQFAWTLHETNLPGVLNAAREQLSTSLSPLDIGRLSYDPYGFTRLPDEGTAAPAALTMGQEWFASKDGTFRVMFIGPGKDLGNYRDSAAWFEQVEQIVQDCEKTGKWAHGIKIGFTGTPAFMADIAVGMERDIKSSVLGTLVVIGLLFWLAHRRWIPLLWLLVLLNLILACTMAAGGILFGTLNVVSLGFTAILLGLAVDYALVLYQEAVSAPERPIAEVRRIVAPAIWWSALTTAGAFFLLNFGGMPGLSQLGSLVAVGILIAATVMIYAYLPVALRKRPAVSNVESGNPGTNPSSPSYLPWALTVVIICGVALILWRQFPGIDHSTKPLQPSHSAAEIALQEMKTKLDQPGEPVLMLVSGTNETAIATRLERMQEVLSASVSNKEIRSFTLPHQLWPRPEYQRENRATALQLARQEESLRAAALRAGFTTNALDMAQSILSSWRVMVANPATIWPSNEANRWIIEKVVGRTETGLLALGVAYGEPDTGIYKWSARLTQMVPGISVTGWHLLGESLLERVEKRTVSLSGAMLVFVALCLWLAFRTIREVLLSFAALALSLLMLLAVMSLAGWSWNLLNLMALPLLLGSGVDYTIHMQLALRRHHGDCKVARRGTGRAVFLCAATTIAGFGSLAWSSNSGLASLGVVCATGVGCVLLTSLFLLPAWWYAFNVKNARAAASSDAPKKPSSFYRRELWVFGMWVARTLPRSIARLFCRVIATLYSAFQKRRREVVVQNLLPVLGGDRRTAEKTARALFAQFAFKLADLWRLEAGAPLNGCFNELCGWEHFEKAHARGRGVLIITPHLGNWELGGPLLVERGLRVLVITQSEPGNGFTEIRQQSRARWGVETLVIGDDAFAGLEIVHRLRQGATVALLLDRPPGGTTYTVDLFGRPFIASAAAAELAWATGCALLGVHVLRENGKYNAHFMPEFVYDQTKLGNRESRRQLTQEILRAFEPIIRQHLDQWYHFVPIWPPE